MNWFNGLIKNMSSVSSSAGQVNVNGKVYQGQNVTMVNGDVWIDGVKVDGSKPGKGMIEGKGPVEDRIKAIEDFDSISCGGIFEVSWKPGAPSAVLRGQANVLDEVELIQKGGKLKLQTRSSVSTKSGIVVELSSPALMGMDVSGVAKVKAQGVSATAFEVIVEGGSQLDLRGVCDELRLTSSGTTKVMAGSMEAKDLRVESSGGSSVEAYFSQKCHARADGVSEVKIGGGGQLDARADGGSKISQFGGECVDAKVRASGVAKVSLTAKGNCRFIADGASGIEYVDAGAAVDEKVSGVASVKSKGAARRMGM